MISVSVRANGVLAQALGASRLRVSLPAAATISDLVVELSRQFPASTSPLQQAIPVINGKHVDPSTRVDEADEVALLMPIAGGSLTF